MKNNARYFALAALALALVAAVPEQAMADGPFQYFPLTPCRLADTRNAVGQNGGPIMNTTARDFTVKGLCGVPTTAAAVTLNITATGGSNISWLTIWPAHQAQPFVSTLNFDQTDYALANGAIVGLAPTTPDLKIANAVGTVHVIVDVTGYFE